MNKRHLKYQQDTGVQVSEQVERLRGMTLTEEIIICPECVAEFTYHPENPNFSNLYDYIQWLEEQITEQEQLLKIAVDLFPDTKEELKIKYFEKNKDQK